MTASTVAVQDRYPDTFAVCYGCGRHNAHGLHVRTLLEGDEGVAWFTPRPEHTAVPGFVYGGLLASLIDCHGVGTAAAIAERSADGGAETAPAPRFVTASLEVSFQRPTPLGPPLELRARVVESSARKSVVHVAVSVDGAATVTGRVVAVRLPTTMGG